MRRSWILTKLLFCVGFSLIVSYDHDCVIASSSPSLSSSPPGNGIGTRPETEMATQPSRREVHGSTERPRIVAFGNSLTAGLGVAPDHSYPAHLQRALPPAADWWPLRAFA